MYTLYPLSTASPDGEESDALMAGPPSPSPCVPPPAKVVIVPPLDTVRTRLFEESEMYRLPELSTANPEGLLSCALIAWPPSPEYENEPLPAIVVITPPD